MKQEILDILLSEKHREAGLYLEQDGKSIHLHRHGELLPLYSFPSDNLLLIKEKADQALGELTNGISFERSR